MLHATRDDETRLTSVTSVPAAPTLSRRTTLSRLGVTVSRELIATARNLLDFFTSRQKSRWALNLHNCATVTVNRRVRACR
jgi:hypothetical protein